MNKVYEAIALLFSFSLYGQTVPFELLNKSKQMVEVDFTGKGLAGHTFLKPGEKTNLKAVDPKNFSIIIRKQGASTGHTYTFNPKPGKKIYVRVVDTSIGLALEPQTFVGFNNLDKKDIIGLRYEETKPVVSKETSEEIKRAELLGRAKQLEQFIDIAVGEPQKVDPSIEETEAFLETFDTEPESHTREKKSVFLRQLEEF